MRLRKRGHLGFVRRGETRYLHVWEICVGNLAANDRPRRDSRDPGLQCGIAVNAVMSMIPRQRDGDTV